MVEVDWFRMDSARNCRSVWWIDAGAFTHADADAIVADGDCSLTSFRSNLWRHFAHDHGLRI